MVECLVVGSNRKYFAWNLLLLRGWKMLNRKYHYNSKVVLTLLSWKSLSRRMDDEQRKEGCS